MILNERFDTPINATYFIKRYKKNSKCNFPLKLLLWWGLFTLYGEMATCLCRWV